MDAKTRKNILARKAVKAVAAAIGGLSVPEKMPCFGTSTPPEKCDTGSKLRDVPDSVCSDCYACKGNYLRPNVQAALQRRYDASQDLTQWVENFDATLAVLSEHVPVEDHWFRFFDAGDLQSEEHLGAICEIARRHPSWRFWVPTKEHGIVRRYLDAGWTLPSNVTLRLSAFMIGQRLDSGLRKLPTSSVDAPKPGYKCPAPKQDGHCADCRACWDPLVPNVDYKRH